MNDQSKFEFAPPPPPPREVHAVQATPPGPPPWWYQQPRGPGAGRRLLRGLGTIILILSIVLNVYLIMALSVMGEARGIVGTVLRDGDQRQVVAVYRVNGMISDRAVQEFTRFYRAVADDENVKAVVLRVDSPGGTVPAADEIHALLKDLHEKRGKKLVVSMGGVAASGGYYISALADEIYAEPTTITGSVGVILAWMVVKGTLDKLGMEAMVLKSTDAEGWKDAISPLQKPDQRQAAATKDMLDTVQTRFEQVVRDGRGTRLKTREITYTVKVGEGEDARLVQRTDIQPLNGQVFMPEQAKELGLIDAVGYEDAAIDRAAELAGLTKPKVVIYKAWRPWLQRLAEAKEQEGVQIGPELLDRLQSPRLLMLWKAD